MTTPQEKSQAAFDRFHELGGSGVWESDMVVISLEGTSISDDDLALFEDFNFVQILTLNDTQITDAGLSHLEQLTQLESLSLVNTQATEAGISKLKVVLPTVTIETEPTSEDTVNPFTGKPFGE
ncbi:MAG: hypothetical protein COA78_23200 [Blastopirellula sp.]|nr:MAG: hypothetical protein COA78_23200 [Blastopirellula sp.]